MRSVFILFALAVTTFGRPRKDELCMASEATKALYIACMKRTYQAFDVSVKCSTLLGLEESHYMDLTCGDFFPNGQQKQAYSACLQAQIPLDIALTLDMAKKQADECKKEALQKGK